MWHERVWGTEDIKGEPQGSGAGEHAQHTLYTCVKTSWCNIKCTMNMVHNKHFQRGGNLAVHTWLSSVTWWYSEDLKLKPPESKATTWSLPCLVIRRIRWYLRESQAGAKSRKRKIRGQNQLNKQKARQGQGLAEVAQSVERLPCKREGLSLGLRHLHKKSGIAVSLHNPNTEGGRDRGISRPCWPTRLAKLESSNVSERPSLKK